MTVKVLDHAPGGPLFVHSVHVVMSLGTLYW